MRSETHTEWDTRGVGHTWSGTHREGSARSEIRTERNTHPVGYTRSSTHMEWDTERDRHGVGYAPSEIRTQWNTHGVRDTEWDIRVRHTKWDRQGVEYPHGVGYT